ncbi:urease accessory protein UreD [Rufibacter sediminis]|uniref:Urease accessory protein UreD n=1 Tax=Rufibacter sediminis TaxID=2762756 RepID=A0ABR6VXY7_9BACT|nr:urease accessory protein UreD [Rufibacter sediminis]MBC3542006.1 urease accessory protein UreD [Rufibacter sediminis]
MERNTQWSEVEVALTQGKSRLVTSKSLQPLKLLNPGSSYPGCHVVLSSYGGGMVSGDQINLRITCGAQAKLFVSTQANTKIFKSTNGATAEQHITAQVAENALAVSFPDPVVPQEHSRFRQTQHWHLHPSALLLVVDWFHSGRMDQSERFQFYSFSSELKVSVGEKLVLLDRFSFSPEDHIATSPANFDVYQTMFSAYLVGPPQDERFAALAQAFQELKMTSNRHVTFHISDQDHVISVSEAREGVYLLRAMGKSRQDLEPICQHLLQTLSTEAFFGYNPLERKY